MPGPATGEVFAFPEGRVYLYASASGATSGSGIGWVENARLSLTYGWYNYRTLDTNYHDLLTGQRAEMTVQNMLGDLVLYNLLNGTAAVNAKFEGLMTATAAVSAQWVLYSGVIDSFQVEQVQGDVFKGSYSMHANIWSAFGQG